MKYLFFFYLLFINRVRDYLYLIKIILMENTNIRRAKSVNFRMTDAVLKAYVRMWRIGKLHTT